MLFRSIDGVVEHALRSVFASARQPLRPLYELEREQLRALVDEWLRCERARGPFKVLAVEQDRALTLGRHSVSVRSDRLDRLEDGTVAVIDYKTGDRATSADWFLPRLRDAQVPLYAIATTESLGAVVIARVRPGRTSYSGFWPEGSFTGRSGHLAAGWSAQLSEWRAQLTQLASEFASGDVRIFADDSDDLRGAYAPLSRIAEQLALARGAAERW